MSSFLKVQRCPTLRRSGSGTCVLAVVGCCCCCRLDCQSCANAGSSSSISVSRDDSGLQAYFQKGSSSQRQAQTIQTSARRGSSACAKTAVRNAVMMQVRHFEKQPDLFSLKHHAVDISLNFPQKLEKQLLKNFCRCQVQSRHFFASFAEIR